MTIFFGDIAGILGGGYKLVYETVKPKGLWYYYRLK